jgi:DNA-binding SARP family transcriptional activator
VLPNSAWRSALARYLLFYLLIHPPQTRDQIIADFWPDLAAENAKSTFHVVKSQTRSPLGRSLILFQDDRYTVQLEPDCWFDVATFESLLQGQDQRQARLEEAVALYRGDFLEDYDAEWCQATRERLRLAFRSALLELGTLYSAQRQLDRALVTLQRVVELDDLFEPACRALMQVYILQGDTAAALEQYDSLAQRLEEQVGIDPSSETQTLYRSILRSQDNVKP